MLDTALEAKELANKDESKCFKPLIAVIRPVRDQYALLKTVAHIISCRHGRENDTYHIVYSCVQIVYSVLCIVYCSGKEVAAVPPHLALVAGSTL